MRRSEALLLLGATTALAPCGCAEDFVELDCGGQLKTWVASDGDVRSEAISVESRDVRGGLTKDRFWISFPSPEPADGSGDWLIDFGFNPLGGFASLDANLSGKMAAWHKKAGGPEPFSVSAAEPGDVCEVERGTLCGGLGVDRDGSGTIEREGTGGAERYHRAKSGMVEFQEMRTERWQATFSIVMDADEDSPTTLGGEVHGCFRALLVTEGGVDHFQ